MNLELAIAVGAILVLVILAFLFSGTEAAITASSKARLHNLENNGDSKARRVTRLNAERDRLLGALLIGNNLVRILAAALATSILTALFGPIGILYATVTVTVIFVIFSEILPRSWALVHPEQTALSLSGFARLAHVIFGPLSLAANAIVRFVLGLFGTRFSRETPMLSAHDELRGAVEVLQQEGSMVKQDLDRVGGLLDLNELEVCDIMVHRTAMRSVNADNPPAMVVDEILKSPYTRTPIWRGSAENIIGVVHTKDLLRALHADNRPEHIDITKIAKTPWFVPDTTSLQMQLNAFLRRKAHMAIVVDEYGEVQGLVTLEDIIEEIVGDIADEHDVEVQGVRQEADGSIVVEGSVPIRDLNRALDWNLPDEEATTIAGLVIHESQTIPEEKQAFTFFDKRFIVMKREKNRIIRLRIRPIGADEAAKLR